jgi:hypothetical protein
VVCQLLFIGGETRVNKLTFLILSIAAIVLATVGNSTKSGVITDIGGVVALVTWILGLVKMVQLSRWGWFVAVLLLPTFGTLLYGIYGPEHHR